jgi:glycosyltransferase involved in cell wall biosynthesis
MLCEHHEKKLNIEKKASDNRVLVVTPQPFYEERGTPIAVRYLLNALSELGYEVDLLAFPVGSDITLPGLTIQRVSNPLGVRSVPIGFSWRKLYLDIGLALKLRRLLRSRQYCYVHAVEEAAFLMAALQRKSDPPFLYDMASSIPEQLRVKPLMRAKLPQKILQTIEANTITKAAYVLCSGGLKEYAQEKSPETPISEWWFPSMSHPSQSALDRTDLRQKLGIGESDILLVYTGSFAAYQGINMLLQAMTLLASKRQKLYFLLVGATPEAKASLESEWPSTANGMIKLSILERRPREAITEILEAADVLLSPRLFGANTPLKIFDYMGIGKPIIASDIPAHRAFLTEDRAVFFENNPESLAASIDELLNNPAKISSLSSGSLSYAKKYLTWDRFRDHQQNIIDQLGCSEGNLSYNPTDDDDNTSHIENDLLFSSDTKEGKNHGQP